MCGDSRHDLNYPELPDSWGELFENDLNYSEIPNSWSELFERFE